jgi:hypothetical protein
LIPGATSSTVCCLRLEAWPSQAGCSFQTRSMTTFATDCRLSMRIGERQIKNIARPVRMYHLQLGQSTEHQGLVPAHALAGKFLRLIPAAAAEPGSMCCSAPGTFCRISITRPFAPDRRGTILGIAAWRRGRRREWGSSAGWRCSPMMRAGVARNPAQRRLHLAPATALTMGRIPSATALASVPSVSCTAATSSVLHRAEGRSRSPMRKNHRCERGRVNPLMVLLPVSRCCPGSELGRYAMWLDEERAQSSSEVAPVS